MPPTMDTPNDHGGHKLSQTRENIAGALFGITVLLIAPAVIPWISEIIARWITG